MRFLRRLFPKRRAAAAAHSSDRSAAGAPAGMSFVVWSRDCSHNQGIHANLHEATASLAQVESRGTCGTCGRAFGPVDIVVMPNILPR